MRLVTTRCGGTIGNYDEDVCQYQNTCTHSGLYDSACTFTAQKRHYNCTNFPWLSMTRRHVHAW